MSSSGWIDFWDTKHSIYVNARHEAAHFRRIADDMLAYAPPGGVMLDYGCGEALEAARVAEPLARLILCEPAPNVRATLGARFAGHDKIDVRKPEDVSIMTAGSIDVVVMHSVAQYLNAQELDALIGLFRRLLKPGGLLVLGDVIPRGLSTLSDVRALMRFGRQEGFFWAALRGLIRTFFSDYRRLRQSLGIARYDRAEIAAKLESSGFSSVEPARTNIGHNSRRMTFLAHVR
jgi:SAM-dependent methyltransferase